MLRPKRMSRVSVTGSKAVMDDVVETTHGLNLVHFTDYDGRWSGFDNGDPMAGSDEAAEKLVTVRALQSTLGVEEEDAGPNRIIDEESLETELEEVRTETNELDDRRSEVQSELRDVEERIDAMEPFAQLGIDLDLLWGYDSVSVAVGEGDEDDVEAALAELDVPTGVFSGGDYVAAFAETDESELADALVAAEFSAVAVPEEEGDPSDVVAELEERRRSLESKLETVENQLEDLRYDVAGFLLAAEEELAIEVQKTEAPLSFATTENAFVAEGWIPSERVDEFESALAESVGEHVDVEELEVAEYDRHGQVHHTEEAEETDPETGAGTGGGAGVAADEADDAAADADESTPEAATDGGERSAGTRSSSEVRSDGGMVTMRDEGPPVIQDNPSTMQPFELLTKAVGRPNYSEFDPTFILFLTFPLMFGFIIGDVGYGIIYAGIGYYLYKNFDSDAFRNMGVIAAAAGIATFVFGLLYGEIFGLHLVTEYLWVGALGMDHAPLAKGLAPAESHWALAWFIVTTLFGVLHLNTAYVMEFVEEYQFHGFGAAMKETGSWLLALNGLWLFVFSRPPTSVESGETVFHSPKPDFIYRVFDQGSEAAISLGFSGVPSPFAVGTPMGPIPLAELVGVLMIVASLVLLATGPAHELIEIHVVLAHALSYLRISAVLLAKAGMAFAANLLFFGAYTHHGEFHFMLDHGPAWVAEEYGQSAVMFEGMMHMGPAMLVFGILVLILAHLVVLILGVTSAGIQSIRLEYFEFFEKFYEGDGTPYSPFGQERTFTADDGS